MNKETQSFEDYLATAKLTLEKLSNPDVTLVDSVALYKNGLESVECAQKLLDEAKLIIEEASQK